MEFALASVNLTWYQRARQEQGGEPNFPYSTKNASQEKQNGRKKARFHGIGLSRKRHLPLFCVRS